MSLVEEFDKPIHPNEVRTRFYELEEANKRIEALLSDEIQRNRMLEKTVLMLGDIIVNRAAQRQISPLPSGGCIQPVEDSKSG